MKRKSVLTIIILLNLIVSGILIGAPIETTYIPIIIVTLVLCMIYFLLSDVKIIRNKIDIFIIIFGASTLIPLIFNTAVSITSEINYIFKYISAILLYICVREHIINYPDTRKKIINCIIFSSLILIILGMDNMSTKIFTNPLSLINIKIEEIEKNRLTSVFCYANALAIVTAISVVLNNINYLKEENRVKKSLYGVITTFLFIGLILTYSRFVIAFLALFLIIYCFLIKNKLKIYDLIKLMLISLIISCIYNFLFFKLINENKYIIMWLSAILALVISFVINYFSFNLEKKIENIKIKKILIIGIIIGSVGIILVLSMTGNLNVFKNQRKEHEIQIGKIKPNEEYTFDFEFGEIDINENIENFKIKLVEMNDFLDEYYTINIDEKDFLTNKQIKIKTQENTSSIKIVFNKIDDNCKIIINKLLINGKPKVLDYKLIPDELEDRIQNTLMSKKGLYERKVFIEDGIRLIKDNFLFGKGGNAWEYELYNYQQYYYVATQVHSYIIQVGVEYGILAIISLSVIIILTIVNYVKSRSKHEIEQVSIIISILLLICHSCIDFEMTYLYIMQIFFTLLAIMFSFNIENKKENQKNKYVFSISIIILLIFYIFGRTYYDSSIKINQIKQISKESSKNNLNNFLLEEELMLTYEDYFKLEKHNIVNINYYFNYAHVVQRNMREENIDKTAEKLEFVYNVATKIKPKYEINYLMLKYDECKLIADKIRLSKTDDVKLKQLEKQFYELVLNESKETEEKIEKDYRLYRITKEVKDNYVKRLEDLNSDVYIKLTQEFGTL